jgi:hypothetical protein
MRPVVTVTFRRISKVNSKDLLKMREHGFEGIENVIFRGFNT